MQSQIKKKINHIWKAMLHAHLCGSPPKMAMGWAHVQGKISLLAHSVTAIIYYYRYLFPTPVPLRFLFHLIRHTN